MFTNIRVKNFKSLVDVDLNLIGKKKQPKNLVLIYGENGSGKSNVSSIFYTLIETIRTMKIRDKIQMFLGSEEEELFNDELLKKILKSKFKDMESIVKESKTIDSDDNLYMEFEFNIDNKKGTYSMEFDDKKIIAEKLQFTIDTNKGVYFDLNLNNKKLNPSVFRDNTYITEIQNKIEKFWGKHTLLSILSEDIEEKNEDYFKEKLSSNFFRMLEFFEKLSCQINIGNTGTVGKYIIDNPILGHLLNGEINSKDQKELETIEGILNEIFTSLYADIKEIHYELQVIKKKIKYKLFCKKVIGGRLINIPFDLESTGTLSILDLIPAIIMAVKGGTVVIDEFDSGIHDLMVQELVSSINNSLRGQLILTTHNTLLMECDIPSDSLYFITIDENGDKEILCLDDYQHRTHPNHNIRSLYLKGLYDGIPITRDLDLEYVINLMNNN